MCLFEVGCLFKMLCKRVGAYLRGAQLLEHECLFEEIRYMASRQAQFARITVNYNKQDTSKLGWPTLVLITMQSINVTIPLIYCLL